MTIKFKILQMADNAAHLLAVAKSKAEAVISEFSNELGFVRSWNISGVDVRMQATRYSASDWLVRLWIGEAQYSFYYTANVSLPNTCGRTLHIRTFDKGTPPSVPPVESFADIPPSSSTSELGPLFFSNPGTACEFGCQTTLVTVNNGSPPGEYTIPPPSDLSAWTGTYTIVHIPPGATSNIDIIGAWTDYRPAAEAAHAAAQQQYLSNLNSDQHGKSYYVALSDGTELLRWHAIYTGVYPYEEVNKPITLTWSGDGFVPLEGNAIRTFGVPEDVRAPSLPDDPPFSGVVVTGRRIDNPDGTRSYETRFVGPNGTYVLFGSSALVIHETCPFPVNIKSSTTFMTNVGTTSSGQTPPSVPGGSFVPVVAIANGSYSFNRDTCSISDNGVIAGELTYTPVYEMPQYISASADSHLIDSWIAARNASNVRARALHKNCSDLFVSKLSEGVASAIGLALRVGHPKSTKTLMASLMTGSVVASTIGSGLDVTHTRQVTLRYTDIEGALQEETINGTRHVHITECRNFEGVVTNTYTTETYINWLPIDTETGSTGMAVDHTFVLDNGSGLAQVQNGVVIAGASNGAFTLDTRGEVLNPPMLASSDARTYSYPTIYLRYREEIERQEGITGNTRWLDSVFADAEVIDVIPTYAFLNGIDLGLFPTERDSQNLDLLTTGIDRVITFKYSYETGAWEFVRIKQGPMTPVEGVPYNNTKFVIVSKSAEWDAVKLVYAAQVKRFADEESLSQDEFFMKQVKKAAATL